MMEAARTSETSVDNPEDNSELHTRRRENFKSYDVKDVIISIVGLVYLITL
jgi:hypothetical protein